MANPPPYRLVETSGPQSPRIKVLLVGLPRWFGDVLTEVAKGEQDFELIFSHPTRDLRSQVLDSSADAVIAGMVDHKLPRDCEKLLWMQQPRAVLGVEEHSGRAVLHRLRPEAVELGEVSPEQLLAATRAAATEVPMKDRWTGEGEPHV